MIGLTIDPGVENGACLFSWSADSPMHIEQVFQFGDGCEGLAAWMEFKKMAVLRGRGMTPLPTFSGFNLDALIVEKFTPRQSDSFNLTLKSVEPLRGEGVLLGRRFGPFIQWAEPAQQYFMGHSRLPLDEKKKLSRRFLETHGIKPTGKTVGRANADDAISATLHTIAWFRRQRHMPTIRALFPEGEQAWQ